MVLVSRYLFLPFVFIFAVLASWYDAKYRKIPNWVIVRIFLIGFFLNFVFFFRFPSSIFIFLIHLIFSFSISVLLWIFEVWQPGDAKFYMGLSLFFHPIFIQYSLAPLSIFLLVSATISVLHSLINKEMNFKPKTAMNNLFLLILFSFFPFFNVFLALPVFFALSKLMESIDEKIPLHTTLFIFLLSLLLFPQRVLGYLLISPIFLIASSVEIKGSLPSAPMIGVSFIYSLLVYSL